MASESGLPGTAIGAIAVGALLVYFGIQDIEVKSGLRELLSGKLPTPGVQKSNETAKSGFGRKSGGSIGSLTPDGSAGSTGGSIGNGSSKFLSVVRAQIGKPYVWAAVGPNSFDCSGLVVYALRQSGKDVGRLVTWTFLTWSGATTVGTPQAGDLVCWTGHIGVYTSNGRMIHAPSPGLSVMESAVTAAGHGTPIYRRIKW